MYKRQVWLREQPELLPRPLTCAGEKWECLSPIRVRPCYTAFLDARTGTRPLQLLGSDEMAANPEVCRVVSSAVESEPHLRLITAAMRLCTPHTMVAEKARMVEPLVVKTLQGASSLVESADLHPKVQEVLEAIDLL